MCGSFNMKGHPKNLGMYGENRGIVGVADIGKSRFPLIYNIPLTLTRARGNGVG